MTERAGTAGSVFLDDADDTEAQQFVRTLVDAIDDGVFYLDADGRFVAVDDDVLDLTGYDREELLDVHVSELLADVGDDTERRLTSATEGTERVELEVETAGGRRDRWDVQVRPVEANGTVRGTVGVVRERAPVSEPERERDEPEPEPERAEPEPEPERDEPEPEPERAESERDDGELHTEPESRDRRIERERVMEALEVAREGISLLDEGGTFVYVNEAYAELFGYDRDEMVGEHWKDLGIEADPDRFTEDVLPRIADEGQWTGTSTCVRSDGSTFAGEHSLTHTQDDQLICVVRDVTERVEHRQDTERYERIVETVTDGVYVVDEEGRFTMVNRAYAEMLGYDREELLGEHVSMVVDDEVRQRARQAEAAMLGDVAEGPALEAELETADGEYVTAEATFAMLPGSDDGWHRVGIVRDVTERTERERKLERYERIFENLPVGVYRNTPGADGEFVTVNETLASLFDADSVEELQEYNVSDLYTDPDQRAEFSRQLQREGMVEDVELEQETLDGETIWISVTAIRTVEDGEVYFDGVVQDVTERKLTKQQLEQERDMFAEGPAIVFRWRNEEGWPVEYVSENVEDVLGYAPEELESGDVPYTDLLLEEEIDRIASEVEEAAEGETERFSHEPYRVRTSDGEIRWVKDTTKIIRDEEGDAERFLGYLVDVTERKERERALEESEKQLRALIDLLPVAVFVAEADGEIVEWNEAAEEIWGGEIVESDSVAEYDQYDGWWADTGEPLEPDDWALARALRGEEVTDPDVVEIEGFDGERRTVLNHGMPVRDAEGEVTRAVATLIDVTERREYQRKLEESNERLEQFAYAASHDLQEPLRMVSSYLQLIERRYADQLDEDGREFIEFAVDGADRMRDMIEGLLQYSRVDSKGDPFEPVDLDDVLADVREDLHVRIEDSDAEITAESLPRVHGDEGQLRQLFQNLLENAIEYSGDEPPTIDVAAERAGIRARGAGAERAGGRGATDERGEVVGDAWAISVSDDGIGVDPEDADRIFDIFQSFDTPEGHSGTGIGLALCRRIVERHGGEIRVDSEPGEGATFTFTLPAADEPGE